ncbi:MAG: type II toxin-antitoxin system mRNA interferase toxin, RelE/StbE family [Alphaproteobacteria bacterium]
MIESIRHRGLRRLFERGDKKLISPGYLERLENILVALDSAQNIEELALPGFRLHPLTGNLKGYWSITVSANWRVIFRFVNGQVLDVDLVDYH